MIKDLENGSSGTGGFFCQKVTEGITKAGKAYQSVVLRDCTGLIDGKAWDVATVGLKEGEYYRIDYSVQDYNGALQLRVNQRELLDKESIDLSQFNPRSKYDVTAMFKDIVRLLESVENPWLKKLIVRFLKNEEALNAYKNSSAAVKVHHAFVGGLVQHTRGIMLMANTAAKIYEGVDRDLLLTAAFFHDVGKLQEIAQYPENRFTAYGVLIGHVTLSSITVDHLCESIEGFPPKLKFLLMHCLLAHHGELEYGSPAKPALKEAIILSALDGLDADIEIFDEAYEKGGYCSPLGTTVLREEEFECLEHPLY